ncbi:hypothetical protein PISMIDRAFT_397063 [Pisolithus microcarpus 441]|uniref:Uncharacterized protein n=1 Tax=Pisolithus microcarpus 441 TaxID=765257 RepID=A0A0C9ZY51_9AGAM|nr:hypothetical protein PISMIDRAFT_397063 [Pisolithus microcarpus 441]
MSQHKSQASAYRYCIHLNFSLFTAGWSLGREHREDNLSFVVESHLRAWRDMRTSTAPVLPVRGQIVPHADDGEAFHIPLHSMQLPSCFSSGMRCLSP